MKIPHLNNKQETNYKDSKKNPKYKLQETKNINILNIKLQTKY